MSNSEDKFRHSRRLQKEENAVNKQVKIVKNYGLNVKEPHKYAKHHSMNCGNPTCPMCSNPRHSGFYKGQAKLTQQERRLFQDTDKTTDKKSNGLIIKDENE